GRYGNAIAADYQHLRGRAPEPGAVTFWETQLQAGLTLLGLETEIIGSQEFYARSGGTDRDFITSAHQAVFGSVPSGEQLGFFLAQMGDPAATTTGATTLLTLDLKPLDINLLGLEVQTNDIMVNVSAEPGQGELLGN